MTMQSNKLDPANWVERMVERGYTFEILPGTLRGEDVEYLCIGLDKARKDEGDLDLWHEYRAMGTAPVKAFLLSDPGTRFLEVRA